MPAYAVTTEQARAALVRRETEAKLAEIEAEARKRAEELVAQHGITDADTFCRIATADPIMQELHLRTLLVALVPERMLARGDHDMLLGDDGKIRWRHKRNRPQ